MWGTRERCQEDGLSRSTSRVHSVLSICQSQWGSQAFHNMRIIPPGSGIIHQVNLEYLARVVFDQDGYYYPDSLVGTDSHTTMIDGLGILGWGECSSRFLFHICCLGACTLIHFESVTSQ